MTRLWGGSVMGEDGRTRKERKEGKSTEAESTLRAQMRRPGGLEGVGTLDRCRKSNDKPCEVGRSGYAPGPTREISARGRARFSG